MQRLRRNRGFAFSQSVLFLPSDIALSKADSSIRRTEEGQEHLIRAYDTSVTPGGKRLET